MAEASGKRAGRGWGPLRGDLVEVRELAQWLRSLIETSMTLRELEESLPFGRDKISRSVNGEARPEWDVVEAIIGCCVADPLKKERRLGEARMLWRKADLEAATRVPLPAVTKRVMQPVHTVDTARERELTDQLVQALNKCATLERSLGESQNMVLTLRVMVGELEGRVQSLERERDDLRLQHASEDGAEQIQQQLAVVNAQCERAQSSLEHAKVERDEAERLRAVAENQARMWLEELEQLRRERSDPGSAQLLALAPDAPGLHRQPTDDIDRALDAADQFLARKSSELAEMASGLEGEPLVDVHILPGEMVGQPGLSDADNPPTSDVVPDNGALDPQVPTDHAGEPTEEFSAHPAMLDAALKLVEEGYPAAAERVLARSFVAGNSQAGILLADRAIRRRDLDTAHAILDRVGEADLDRMAQRAQSGLSRRVARNALIRRYLASDREGDVERVLRAHADTGDVIAQFDFAHYLLGKGRRTQAIKLLELASAAGSTEAAGLLAKSTSPNRVGLKPGMAVAKQQNEAEVWLQRGRYYRDEVRDWRESAKYLRKAADLGNTPAAKELRHLLDRMVADRPGTL